MKKMSQNSLIAKLTRIQEDLIEECATELSITKQQEKVRKSLIHIFDSFLEYYDAKR